MNSPRFVANLLAPLYPHCHTPNSRSALFRKDAKCIGLQVAERVTRSTHSGTNVALMMCVCIPVIILNCTAPEKSVCQPSMSCNTFTKPSEYLHFVCVRSWLSITHTTMMLVIFDGYFYALATDARMKLKLMPICRYILFLSMKSPNLL